MKQECSLYSNTDRKVVKSEILIIFVHLSIYLSVCLCLSVCLPLDYVILSYFHSWLSHWRRHPPGCDLCDPVAPRGCRYLLDLLLCVSCGDLHSQTGPVAAQSLCRVSQFWLYPEWPQRACRDNGLPDWRSGAGLFDSGCETFKGHQFVW